jgi:hypothetical protein
MTRATGPIKGHPGAALSSCSAPVSREERGGGGVEGGGVLKRETNFPILFLPLLVSFSPHQRRTG